MINLSRLPKVLLKHVAKQLQYTPPECIENEQERLQQLHELAILDTPPEKCLDDLTQLMSQFFKVPIALVSLVDEDRQWFKSRQGLDVSETPRDISFCGHAVAQNDTLVIEDALLDDRFKGNPLVLENPNIRFYAGAVIRSASGLPLGTCCIIDEVPRCFSENDAQQLQVFANLVQDQLLHAQHVAGLVKHATSLAYYNELTGLPNKKLFLDRLDQMIVADAYGKGIKTCVVRLVDFIELTELKGKQWLDNLVYFVAIRLRAHLDMSVNLSYLEEGVFALFNYEKNNKQNIPISESNALEQLIINCLSEVINLDDDEHYLNIKIGISSYPLHSLMAETLLNNALNASYGTGLLNYFHKSDHIGLSKRHTIQQEIHYGIDGNCFYMEYQPIVNAQTGAVSSFEALVRLKDRQGNNIPPTDFIEIAEESEDIIRIGDMILESVCEALQYWHKTYPDLVKPVAVNLSHRQLILTDLPVCIEEKLNRYSIPANLLQLEVTESGLLVNLEKAIENISAIAKLGVTFSLDDFGTGYSSLSYLQKLDVVKLKLDKSFIDDICDNRSDYVLVRAIISLSHELEKKVVAEGVENSDQLALLTKHHCDYIQGYYFSRPIGFDGVEALFKAGTDVVTPKH